MVARINVGAQKYDAMHVFVQPQSATVSSIHIFPPSPQSVYTRNSTLRLSFQYYMRSLPAPLEKVCCWS